MQSRDIVVIGGSAGGLAALLKIVRNLPAELPAAMFVVIHTPPDNPGTLAPILANAGPLPAVIAVDGEPVRTGRIYVPPADRHLLLERGRVRVTRGPREHRFRPAVDPLFRTAANAYGPRVVGVILSGGQHDGALGLSSVKAHGGVTIAQDPSDAATPSMPEHAIRESAVDHVLRADDMPAVISGLVGKDTMEALLTPREDASQASAETGTADVLDIADRLGPPSVFTCPECGGSLWELREGDLLRYQCHVGHRFSGESLIDANSDGLEAALWTALRALQESSALRRRMAKHARNRGMSAIADSYEQHARQSDARAMAVRRVLVADPNDKEYKNPGDR